MKTYEQRGHDSNKGDIFAYDAIYRLTGMKFNSPEPANPASEQFEKQKSITFDKLSNILNIDETINDQTQTITTDIPADSIYSKLNQYERFDRWGLSYDLNGNLTQKSTQHNIYDYQNRIVRATDVDSTVKFKYDALGRRIQKEVTIGSQNKITNFYYSGHQVIEERDGSDQVTRQLIYGNGIDEVIRVDKYTGTTSTPYYLHINDIGSITAITDANGNIVERVYYDIYGKPTFKDASGNVIPKSSIGNNILFQGREYDPELNLYYFRARYYDPIMGRFLSTDPMGYADSMNLYQGFNMNPVNFIDPLGKWGIGVHEEITQNALKKFDFSEYWNIKEFRKGLIKGSKFPDIPEGYILVGIAYINYKTGHKSDSRSYQTHYGNLGYWHSMRTGNQTSEEVKEKIEFDVINWIVTARTLLFESLYNNELTVKRRKVIIEKAGILLGMALHIIEDSYSPGHTYRDKKTMEIIEFFDYDIQQKTKKDKEFHEAGDIKEGNEFYFDTATGSIINIMKLFEKNIPNQLFQLQLEQLLENEVLVLRRPKND